MDDIGTASDYKGIRAPIRTTCSDHYVCVNQRPRPLGCGFRVSVLLMLMGEPCHNQQSRGLSIDILITFPHHTETNFATSRQTQSQLYTS